jgi:hypothetical protein
MHVIFCADPWNTSRPDEAFAHEFQAASAAGMTTSLMSYEALVDGGDAARAVRRLALGGAGEPTLYRGWMLRPDAYDRLYHALSERGINLINTPTAYRHCHYLPECYARIRDHTPASVWIEASSGLSLDTVMAVLRPFGSKPVIVKDYVKSRKHEWADACYIPSAADREAVGRVVSRFLELQGNDLSEGLVFREYVEFEPLAIHSKSGMPLTQEYRLIFLEGQRLLSAEYWEEGDYSGAAPPDDLFAAVAQQVQSRFFSMDVGKRRDGSWLIVELGDGQVAGLPARIDVDAFYRALAARTPAS